VALRAAAMTSGALITTTVEGVGGLIPLRMGGRAGGVAGAAGEGRRGEAGGCCWGEDGGWRVGEPGDEVAEAAEAAAAAAAAAATPAAAVVATGEEEERACCGDASAGERATSGGEKGPTVTARACVGHAPPIGERR